MQPLTYVPTVSPTSLAVQPKCFRSITFFFFFRTLSVWQRKITGHSYQPRSGTSHHPNSHFQTGNILWRSLIVTVIQSLVDWPPLLQHLLHWLALFLQVRFLLLTCQVQLAVLFMKLETEDKALESKQNTLRMLWVTCFLKITATAGNCSFKTVKSFSDTIPNSPCHVFHFLVCSNSHIRLKSLCYVLSLCINTASSTYPSYPTMATSKYSDGSQSTLENTTFHFLSWTLPWPSKS